MVHRRVQRWKAQTAERTVAGESCLVVNEMRVLVGNGRAKLSWTRRAKIQRRSLSEAEAPLQHQHHHDYAA